MALTQKDVIVSPYAKPEYILGRLPHGSYTPCPTCGKLAIRHYNTDKAEMLFYADCPDCPRRMIAVDGLDEDGHPRFVLEDTSEPYDNMAPVNELYRELEGTEDHKERASILARIAYLSFRLNGPDCKNPWADARDEFRAAKDSGEDVYGILSDSLFDMIKVKFPEVMEINVELCDILVEGRVSPSGAKECTVWLWYIHRGIRHDWERELDELVNMRSAVRESISALTDEEFAKVPFLRPLDLLWDYDTHGFLAQYEGFDYITDEYSAAMYRKACEEMYAILDEGHEPDPSLLDLFIAEMGFGITFSDDPYGEIDLLEASADKFGRYSDLMRARAVYCRLMLDLCHEIELGSFFFRPSMSPCNEEQIDMLCKALEMAECYMLLSESGRTLVDGYLLLALMTNDMDVVEVADSYLSLMNESGIATDSLSRSVKSVLNELQFPREPRKKNIDRPKKVKVSKKDRVKQKKAEHKAKRRQSS